MLPGALRHRYGHGMKLRAGVPAAVLAAALSLLAASPRTARADTKLQGFSMDRFEPAPAGDAFFGVPGPSAAGHLVPRAALMFDYGARPFYVTLAGQKEPTNIVAAQGFLRVDASLALWDRLLVSVDMPVAVVNAGQDPKIPGVDLHPPSGAAAGDLRIGFRGRIFGADRSPLQAGIGAALFAPTGSPDAYTGDGGLRGALQLSLGGRIGDAVGFVWSASGGAMLRPPGQPHLFTFGGGAAITLAHERVQLGPELYGTTQLTGGPLVIPGTNIKASSTTTLEVLLGLKVHVWRDLVIGAAAGPVPTQSVGSPNFRAVGLLGWSPLPPRTGAAPKPTSGGIGDRDDDGIRDDVDACPDVKGELQSDPSKDGCPPSDRDGDHVLDIDDACPNSPGEPSADATRNGCPKDTDDDGIFDAADACPTVKGEPSPTPQKNGCPKDRDDDGIADSVDACPGEKGPASKDPKWNGCPDDPDADGIKGAADACPRDKGEASADPKQNGCPKLARVVGDEIVINQQVQFQVYGKSRGETVAPVSQELMNEIRNVIQQHPEIVKIEVQGHTDDSGDDAFNQRLSEQRAEAVRQWLIDAGISADKLTAKGYGYTKPVADNRIRQGRQQNRRVQFVIVEKK
jgi:OmpA-OmpF porin, OOP family